jgi:hypothetical protein
VSEASLYAWFADHLAFKCVARLSIFPFFVCVDREAASPFSF